MCWHPSHGPTWQHTTLMGTPMHMLAPRCGCLYDLMNYVPWALPITISPTPSPTITKQFIEFIYYNAWFANTTIQFKLTNLANNTHLLPIANGWKVAFLVTITAIICVCHLHTLIRTLKISPNFSSMHQETHGLIIANRPSKYDLPSNLLTFW